ncbi:hypothetical protein BRARA_E02844, partial [Brassica rapa]
VFARCNPPSRLFADWSELLSWIRTATSKSMVLLRKLASQAVIFHVWKQRNNLIHNATTLSPATVFISLDRELRNLISSRRTKKHFSSLMILWIR